MVNRMFSVSNYIFNIHAVPPLLTAFSVLFLGLIVAVREKGSRVSLLYLIYTLAACTWLFSASMSWFSSSEQIAFQWIKLANTGVTAIPAALFHFTVLVLGTDKQHRLRIRISWIISAFFLALTLLTNVLFERFYHYRWGIFLEYRWPAYLFVAYFFAMTVVILRLYWVEFRKSVPNSTKQRRVKAFLVAIGIGYFGAFDFLPALGVPYYPLSPLPMFCMVILMARTIWRYRLVDITPAIAAQEIIDTMNDALIVIDPDGVVRLVNRATCSTLGHPEQELIGKRPSQGMTQCSDFAGQLESIVRSGTVQNRELLYRSRESDDRVLSLSTSIIYNERGEPVATVCLMNDVTDRKRAEVEREQLIAKLQEANEKLQSIDKMKSNFISMVSHELRTPLTTIKSFVELLLIKQAMPKERKVKLMNTINVETDRLTRLITDLLDLARIEAGSIKWQIGKVSLENVIGSVIMSMGVLFENKGLRVTTAISPPLPPISGDQDRLIQVIMNILSNAVKFTPAGGSIHVAVRHETTPRAHIAVEVSDTGMGIPGGDLEHDIREVPQVGRQDYGSD